MIKNGFKKIIGIGLFVLFGFCFSTCFGSNLTIPVDSCVESNCLLDTFGNFDSVSFEKILYNPVIDTFRGWFWYNGQLANYYYGFNYNDGWNGPRNNAGTNNYFCLTGYLGTCTNFTGNVSDFYSLGSITLDSITWVDYDNYNNAGNLCLNLSSPSNSTYCFEGLSWQSNGGGGCDGLSSNFTCIADISANSTVPHDASIVVSNAGYSPFVGGGGGGTLIPTSTDVDVAINYYETTKGFNKNMCYVGTNNLTADFGTAGISFEDGSGSTIFELYHSQFSGFGNNIITNVGKFINVRTLNYGQWFYEGDNIKRLATDNGPDNGISYIYTGFTFPFANKPVAIFFMASNLLDGYFTEQSMGNDVAFYCYLKLNYSQIKEGNISYTGDVLPLVPPAIQNNVEDHFKYQLNYGNTGYYYSPDWIGSWTGDYELSDNLELDGVFTNFLDNFNSKLGNINFGYTFGIIPDWILFPLIFLILFRIMKH